MTATELVAIARKGRPNVRYASNAKGNAVAAWSDTLSRWVPVAALLVTGEWCEVPCELLIDGKPVWGHGDSNWTE